LQLLCNFTTTEQQTCYQLKADHHTQAKNNDTDTDRASIVNAETPDISMSAAPHLLRLPCELRDFIFDYYVHCDGGYVYSFESNKLTNTDGSAIDLSLAFTYCQLAVEMRGAALRKNTITFRTFFSPATREKAGMLHAAVNSIHYRKLILLDHIAPRLLTLDMAQSIVRVYPKFCPLLNFWMQQGQMGTRRWGDKDFGEAPSI
jgi:hypothetical protein